MDVCEDFSESSFEMSATSTVVWEDMSFFEKLVEEEECGAAEGPAARPRARRTRKPKDIQCSKCSNKYASLEGYAAHLRAHTWNDMKSRVPTKVQLCSMARECVPSALEEAAASNSAVSAVLQGLDRCCADWMSFLNFIILHLIIHLHSHIHLLPTQFLEACQGGVLQFLGTTDTRVQAQQLLSKCFSGAVSKTEVSVVCQKFVFKLVDHLVIRHLQLLKGQTVTNSDKHPALESNPRVMKVIHYAAGSVVKSIRRRTLRHPHNRWWETISDVIKKHFLPTKPLTPLEQEASEWTRLKNRGGLTIINENALAFFMSVAQILADNTDKGSTKIPSHVLLLEAMFGNASTLEKWDTLCQGSLSHDDSMHLMVLVSRGFCNTYANGIVRKRRNALKKYASLPTRALVAR